MHINQTIKLISHRGNTYGREINFENEPQRVLEVLEVLDCEIDVWYYNDKFYLGHDEPFYHIDRHFLHNPGLWIHCKNKEALLELNKINDGNLNFFWHQNDDCTLTSKGYIWAFPGHEVSSPKLVMVSKNWTPADHLEIKPYAVCTDYPLC